MLARGSRAAVLLDMYGKTGKMRQKTAVQVRLRKQAFGTDLLREKTLKKGRSAQTSGVDVTKCDPSELRRALCTKARERLQWMVGFCKIWVRASLPHFKTQHQKGLS